MRQALSVAAIALTLVLGLPSISTAEGTSTTPAPKPQAPAAPSDLPDLGAPGWVQNTCSASCPGHPEVSCTGQTSCYVSYSGKADRFYAVCDGHFTLCPFI